VLEWRAGKGTENAIIQLQGSANVKRTLATFARTGDGDPVDTRKRELKFEWTGRSKKNAGIIVDASHDWRNQPECSHPKSLMDQDNWPFSFEWDGCAWRKTIPRQEKL